MKRKVSKGVKRRLLIFGSISVVLIIYTLSTMAMNVYRIVDLNNQKKELQKEIILLETKQEELELELGKLQDPDYIARFARENFLYSKEGEYIIRIDRDNEEETIILEDSTSFNRNLAITTFSLLIVFAIFIRSKKRKNKKKKK